MSDQVVQPQSGISADTDCRPRKIRKLDPEEEEEEVAGESEEGLIHHGTDGHVQNCLEQVDNLQAHIDDLNELASSEIMAIEQKYNKLKKPLYAQRNELFKAIPNFWVTTFVNHPEISSILTEEEEECLHYLDKIDVTEYDDIRTGYSIIFYFQSNPYFHNESLTKEFSVTAVDESSSEIISTSEPVRWKDDEVDLTKTVPEEMPGQRRRRSGLIQTFFTWYLDNYEPHMDDIAEIIKSDVWPNPLRYYLSTEEEVEQNGVASDDDGGLHEVVIGSDDDDDDDGGGQEIPEEVLLDDEDGAGENV